MHIDPCCGGPLPEAAAEEPTTALTRRRMLVAAGVGAGAFALKAVPAGAGTASSEDPTAPSTTTPPPPDDPAALEDSLEGTVDGAAGRDYGFDPPYSASHRDVRPIMFPILGRVSWSDTYLYPRGGGRLHEGQDLMSAKMNKLLAVINGVVIELRHGSGGNSLYLRGDDGYYYCYLHINNDTPGTDDGANRYSQAFGPGIVEGVRVKKGQHIAYVGDSGNAEGSGSHCHFEIRKPNAKWYQAAAINAAYSLDAAEPAREGPQVPPETFVPWNNSSDLIKRQYKDFLGRTAAAANITYWGTQLNTGKKSPQAMMAGFLESAECDDKTHAVVRLYQAFFLRRPDFSGYRYWTGRRRGGYPLTAIADAFARSPEFVDRYGALSNGDFVDRIYRNVLGRAPDAAGKAFWTDKINGGRSRGTVMVQFSDSPENRFIRARNMHIIVAYGSMFRRMPTRDELTAWNRLFSQGHPIETMIALMRVSDEYRWITATTS